MPNQMGEKPRMRLLWATIALLGIAILLLALSVGESFSRSFRPDVDFPLNPGSYPDYASAGSGLAAVNTQSAALFSSDGKCVLETAVDYAVPACSGSRYLSVFYDVGSPDYLVMNTEGQMQNMTAPGGVLFAEVNENGILTVLSEKGGYKGSAAVFDRDLTPLFRWDAGSGYPVAAHVSEKDVLAVLCLSGAGSTLHFFRLDSENPLGTYSLPEGILLDFGFLSDGNVAAVSENTMMIVSPTGEELRSLDFGEQTLAASDLSGDPIVLATASGPAGENAVISLISDSGEILASLPTAREVYSVAAAGNDVLVLFAEEATLFSSRLEEDISRQTKEPITKILFNADGTAYLCGSSGAHLVDIKG